MHRSITRHGRVHLRGPGIDPADEVLHVWEALLQEKSGGIGASHAMMAIRDNFSLWVQRVECLGQRRERNQHGSFELGQRIFPLLSNIHQD